MLWFRVKLIAVGFITPNLKGMVVEGKDDWIAMIFITIRDAVSVCLSLWGGSDGAALALAWRAQPIL